MKGADETYDCLESLGNTTICCRDKKVPRSGEYNLTDHVGRKVVA